MRIALCQLNYLIGDFEGNLSKMLGAVAAAKVRNADIIVFSELATSGYPPRDFLEFGDFVAKSQQTVATLLEVSRSVAIVVGSVAPNPQIEGKDLHNAAFVLADGKVIHQSNKALLPTYDVFDEYRYFEPEQSFSTFVYRGVRIALTICEDLWNIGNENPLYPVCPMDQLIREEPDLMINISASPFSVWHAEERIRIMRENCIRYGLPLIYVNQVGAQTELIFDGGSLMVSAQGHVREMAYFEEQIECIELAELQQLRRGLPADKDRYAMIYRALVLGIRDYFGKLGLKTAVLGLSGGIDSALTAVLAAHALGSDQVHGILMPSAFSSRHSVDDALQLVGNLGIGHSIIPIQPVFETFLETMQSTFAGMPHDVTEENIQARCRAIILMAYSNKMGHVLLNTSNKSEAAVGYGTLYGDMAGGLSVIGDLYKGEVYGLSAYINRQEEIIPLQSITKPPSAELRPNQKDTDSLPDYEILDSILSQYIEHHLGPREIIDLGFDAALVRRVLRLVNMNEFKRFQSPPVLRVSAKAFGMGRRMPIVGKYLS